MSISVAEKIKMPAILNTKFTGEVMQVSLSDGRVILVPVAWYPKLANATKKQLENFKISPSGYGIHWPDLDEDLSVLGFLFGK